MHGHLTLHQKQAIFPPVYDRYTIFSSKEELQQHFGASTEETLLPNYNAAPTQLLPVITNLQNEQIQLFHWGTTKEMANNKTVSPRLINLLADSAMKRPIYQKLINTQRCIIPCDGFYLWKQVSKKRKVPYFCYLSDQVPFAIAGIWEAFSDIDDNTFHTFNMLVKTASAPISDYQEDVPVILSKDQTQQWLEPELDLEAITQITSSNSASEIIVHAVNPRVNEPKNNDAALIQPAPPADQFGNYTLFG